MNALPPLVPGLADLSTDGDCGCCAGIAAATPEGIVNRPGLPAIAYRAGRHSDFKASQLARLSSEANPALARLGSRDDNDFTIALIDAWSVVCDVLTFYQERNANEAWLGTATETRSIVELGRLIGYRPREGVAAGADLVFLMDDPPGAPASVAAVTIPAGTRVQSVPGPDEVAQTFETGQDIAACVAFNAMLPLQSQFVAPEKGDTGTWLKGVSTGLKIGDAILIVGRERSGETDDAKGSELWDFRKLTRVEPDPDRKADRTFVGWTPPLGSINPPGLTAQFDHKFFALRKQASLFGWNAPDPKLLAKDTIDNYSNIGPNDWTFDIRSTERQIHLDAIQPSFVADSWVCLTRPKELVEAYRIEAAVDDGLTKYAVSARVTRLTLDSNENLDSFAKFYRAVSVYGGSEELAFAETPIATFVSGDMIELSGRVDGLVEGRPMIVRGRRAGDASEALIAEPATLKRAELNEAGRTVLVLEAPLANSYERTSTRIHGNVASATHGETTQEILGNGSGARAFQSFALKQKPLTYVSAANARGAVSTLQMRINDLLWQEVPTLYGHMPGERVFETRIADDGTPVIQFGDGATGARLPTGRNNVVATYRKGIGVAGSVRAGSLTTALDRPLGLRDVFNPNAAGGGQDPETLDAARTNAPVTTLTLDRVVSLKNYEDFARGFGGIAKARADWVWDGESRRIALTVAGPDGAPVDPANGDVFDNLVAALRTLGDPFVRISVVSYRPAFFRVKAKLLIDADRVAKAVLNDAEARLRAEYGFAARGFARLVAASEVIATLQATPGVSAVDLDLLRRTSGPGSAVTLHQRLLAQPVSLDPDGSLAAAEILTLDPAPVALGVMA